MPCSDGYSYGASSDCTHVQRRADKNARMACAALRILERKVGLDGLSKEVKDWWGEHKAADLAREKREEEERQRNEKRRAALSKLTKEERQLLGH